MSLSCRYCDARELLTPARYDEALEKLIWEERRERLLRFRGEMDRCRSLAAGLLLENMLVERGVTDLSLGQGEYGKPCLKGSPELFFNLSHSGPFAVCVLSDAPVGVDTEKPQPYRENVARRFFGKDEVAWIEASPDRDRAFVNIWIKKESYLKYLGSGLSKPMESFSVLSGEGMEPAVRFMECKIEGQQVCVCTAEPDAPQELLIKKQILG